MLQICSRKKGKNVIERQRLVVNLLQKKTECAAEKDIFLNGFAVKKEDTRGKLSAKKEKLCGRKKHIFSSSSSIATECRVTVSTEYVPLALDDGRLGLAAVSADVRR